MIVRTLLGLLATCAVAALIWCALSRNSPALKAAAALAGERWYSLKLAEQAVGYYRASADRGPDGAYRFATELRFALAAGEPVTIRERYEFAAAAPHALTAAEHRVRRVDRDSQVVLSRASGQLEAIRTLGGEVQPAEPVAWDFHLDEYLAFESWLRAEQPPAGATLALKSPRLETLELTAEQITLEKTDRDRYRIRKRAAPGDTVIELDDALIPARLELAGVFDLIRTDQATALQTPQPLRRAAYRVPLRSSLSRPEALAQLTLKPTGADARELPSRLTLTANPLLPADGDYRGASLRLPVGHPRLNDIIERLGLAALSPASQLKRLLDYVHSALRYDATVQFPSVLDVLDDPRGDCTEFADLFTALARTAGLPARTVIGMAYSAEPSPALAFHAWNQVQIDGRWQAVDPTWNQLAVDATHWPLPNSERTALLLLTGRLDVAFEVLEQRYHDCEQADQASLWGRRRPSWVAEATSTPLRS